MLLHPALTPKAAPLEFTRQANRNPIAIQQEHGLLYIGDLLDL